MKTGDIVSPANLMGRQCRRQLMMTEDRIWDPNFTVYVDIDAIMLAVDIPEPEVHAFVQVLHPEHGLIWAQRRQVKVINEAG